jgi:hypothetical protein
MAALAGNEVSLVVGVDGQPVAVQVGIQVWREIVAALEDAEDVSLARQVLADLQAAGGDPERAGWLRLEALEQAWAADADR